MEEARVQFFKEIGFDYAKIEETGVFSPVVGINNCKFKQTTTFDDEILVDISVKQYNGIRLVVHYLMYSKDVLVFEGESEHCFVSKEGKIVKLGEKFLPELHKKLLSLVKENK